MSTLSLHTYESLFSTLRQSNITIQISNNLSTFFDRVHPLLLKNLTTSEWNDTFQKQLDNEFKRLQYPSSKGEGPICSRNIQKFFSCYDCTKSNKQNTTTCICVDCFQVDNHKGHNFRYIQTTLAVCDCGDNESLHQQSFCNKHKQKGEEPAVCSKTQETFVRQMQFNIYIFLSLAKIKAPYTDDNKKKEIFGLAIIKKISDFMSKSYINKIIASTLMASKLDKLLPPLFNQNQQSSILHLLTKQQSFSQLNQKLSELILPLYAVKKMRMLVIGQIFKFITSDKYFLGEKNILSKVIFQYFHAQSIVQQQLQLHTPLVMICPFQSIKQRYQGYISFFSIYFHLISCSNQLKIVQLLLSNLQITQLALYYVPKMQKTNKEQFYNLQLLYSKVMTKMIKIVVKSQDRKPILMKIAKNCYQQIKRRDCSPSFSVERTFSLAFFSYIQFDLQNIFDLDNDQILQFFQQQDEFTFIETINQIIKKSFTALKVQNFSQFKRIVHSKDLSFELGPKFLIGIDHIYTKIFINLLLKLNQSSSHEQSFKPLQCYIDSRKYSLEVLFDLFKIEEISKLQQTITTIFLQISTILNYFIYLSQTSFYELIAANWLAPSKVKKDQIFELFQFLTYIYDPSSIKQFKENAQRYIKNDNLIQQFVRNHYDNHKRQATKGKIPNNNFNLSYKSNYVDFKSYKENNSMYYLKLKKYRRTEISRFIFNSNMNNQLTSLFHNIFHMYSQYFRFNQLATSKTIMATVLETIILLGLQTKDPSFEAITQSIIKADYIDLISSQYSKHIIDMYTQNKQKITQQKSNELQNIIPTAQPNRKNKDKIAEKMNLIKNQQQKILSKSIVPQENLNIEENKSSCIICKQAQKHQRLYYLCHTRYSNLAKTCKNSPKAQKINEPMLVISTCGHTVHLQCLKKCLSLQDLLGEQFQFSCFFCKGYSNSLFPIINEQGHEDFEQIQGYLTKYASYILNIVQSNRRLGKKLNYESFNLQQIIFESISQSIYWYAIHFSKYLVSKILPIAHQAILLFRILRRQGQLSICKLQKNNPALNKHSWDSMIHFIKCTLSSIIENEGQQADLEAKINQNFNEFIKTKQLNHEKENLDKIFIILSELSKNKMTNFYQIISKHKIKESYHELYNLPQDLLDLNKEIGKCPTCKKPTSKILICFFCAFKTCEKCESQILKHITFHFSSCIFIRAQLGDLYYCIEDDRVRIQSLYRDYAGDQLQNSQVFPQKSKYLLAHDKRNILYEIGVDDVIQNEMMGSRAQNVCQIQ